MSAYAALVSLRQTLEKSMDEGGVRIFGIRGELQAMHEKVNSLLVFLENSFTDEATQDQMSALETMMREAAYKAEDLIQIPTSGIQDSAARITFRYFRNAVVVSLVLGNRIPVILMLGFSMGYLAALLICTISAVLLHLAIPPEDFPALNYVTPETTRDLHGVLKDFSDIERVVIQNKEASAHAALISLRQILDSALDSGCNKHQLESIHEKVTLLLDFLGNASIYFTGRKSALPNLNANIIVAAHRAKLLIESQTSVQLRQDSYLKNLGLFLRVSLYDTLYCLPASVMLTIIMIFFMDCLLTSASFLKLVVDWFIEVALGFGALGLGITVARAVRLARVNSGVQDNHELGVVIHYLNIIVKDVSKIKDACGNPSDLSTNAAFSSRGNCRNVVVGLDTDLRRMKKRLVQDSSKREVISIVGMGGIGKTTLANQVYDDPDIVCKFDILWATVSQPYSMRHILLNLLDSARKLTKEMQEENDHGLAYHLYQNLVGRRYLIVMDDVWDTNIWDSMSNYFPDDDNGSRVLLTSRLLNVASYPDSNSPLHEMRSLNDDDSWHLLREKVFVAEGCPSELESIGREIARSCSGLPLAIVVIGGVLYKDNRSEIWRDIAKNLKSKLGETLEILGLSYNHLPHHLRPCFLYMGVFPRDSEIPVSRLISLWVAEGFLKPSTGKTLEEVAEDNLKDLINRNLILVCKQSCNGKIITCSMHGLLRDVSQQKACSENFLLVVDSDRNATVETPRILSILSDSVPVDATHDLMSRCYNARSLLFSSNLSDYQTNSYLDLVYLRVLDVLVVHFTKFPEAIIRLIFLRYLAFHYDGPLPPSMSELKNLETIIHHHSSVLKYPTSPWVIWSIPNLRHLYVQPGCLPNPRLPWKSYSLQHLQTLVGIRNFKLSKGIIKRIPNLKKLGISYDVSSCLELAAYQLESLVGLVKLESLKIIVKYNDDGSRIPNDPPKLAFPQKLKKLSLSGCGIPWARMTTIGAFPNLEVLKLRCEACSGYSWETVEGVFPQLKFLLLEHMSLTCWETESEHFPLLQRLVLRSCSMLEEIPCDIGDISTLELMELVDCPSAVTSADQIKEMQKYVGNELLKIRIITLENHST